MFHRRFYLCSACSRLTRQPPRLTPGGAFYLDESFLKKSVKKLGSSKIYVTFAPAMRHNVSALHTTLPTHGYLRTSHEVWVERCRKPEYGTFECLRYQASGNGGYLSHAMVRDICAQYGANYQTIRKHLSKCAKNGWITRVGNGYRWISEELVHIEIAGYSRQRLGQYSTLFDGVVLMSFFGKSIAGLRSYMLVNGDLAKFGKLQSQMLRSLRDMRQKVVRGKKIGITLEEIEARIAHFSREVAIEGADYCTDIRKANLKTEIRTSRKNKKSKIFDPATQSSASKLADRRNARCLFNFETPRGVTKDGESLHTVQVGNVTKIWSPSSLTVEDIKYGPSVNTDAPDLSNLVETWVTECNVSMSTLAKHIGCSQSTVSRRMKKFSGRLITQRNFMVVGPYCPKLVSDLNNYPQHTLPLRGRFHAVRVSWKQLHKLADAGANIQFNNLEGSHTDLGKSRVLTVLVLQNSYLTFREVKRGNFSVDGGGKSLKRAV